MLSERGWRVRPEETRLYGAAILEELRGLGIEASEEGSPFVGPVLRVGAITFGTLEGVWGYEAHPHDPERENCGPGCRAGCSSLSATRTKPNVVAWYVAVVTGGYTWN